MQSEVIEQEKIELRSSGASHADAGACDASAGAAETECHGDRAASDGISPDAPVPPVLAERDVSPDDRVPPVLVERDVSPASETALPSGDEEADALSEFFSVVAREKAARRKNERFTTLPAPLYLVARLPLRAILSITLCGLFGGIIYGVVHSGSGTNQMPSAFEISHHPTQAWNRLYRAGQRETYNQNWDKAEKDLTLALKIADQWGHKDKHWLKTAHALADLYIQQADCKPAKAQALLQEVAAQVADDSDYALSRHSVLMSLADAYALDGQRDKALETCKEILSIRDLDETWKASTTARLARYSHENGDDLAGVTFGSDALQQAKRLDEQYTVADADYALGLAYRSMHRNADAEPFLRDAIKKYEHGVRSGSAYVQALCTLAQVLADENKMAEAKSVLSEANDVAGAELLDTDSAKASVDRVSAEFALKQGDLSQAESFNRRAANLLSFASSDRIAKALVSEQYARVKIAQNEYSLAEAVLKGISQDEKSVTTDVALDLGQIYLRQNRYVDAATALAAAQQMAKKNADAFSDRQATTMIMGLPHELTKSNKSK